MTIEGTDPRLKSVRAYKKRLWHSIEVAVDYVIDVVDSMPVPLEMSRSAFSTNPQVNAYFASADELQREISFDQNVRKFMASKRGIADSCLYLGMGMDMSKKKVFVPVLKGETMQRDVARTAVNFSEHRFVDPSDDEPSLRRKIKERVFMTLVQCALKKLSQSKNRKQELEKQRIILRAKLRNLNHQALGLEPLTQSMAQGENSPEQLKEKLDEIENKLKESVTNIATLDQFLEIIGSVMADPEAYIRVENSSIQLTRMNLISSLKDEDPGEEIIYTTFKRNDEKDAIGRLLKVPYTELLL